MKIIVPGRNKPEWFTHVTCTADEFRGGCGALLEVTRDDLFQLPRENLPGLPEARFNCPSCGKEHGICTAAPFFADIPTREAWALAHPEAEARVVAAQKEMAGLFPKRERY